MCIPGLFGGVPDAPKPPGPTPAPPIEGAENPISGRTRRKRSILSEGADSGSLIIPNTLNIP